MRYNLQKWTDFFSQNKKKSLECPETKEYAKIFLLGYPLKNIFKHIFPLEPKFFFLRSKSSISGFSCFKTYIFIHVKKTISANSSEVGGVKALSDTDDKNSSFFLRAPLLVPLCLYVVRVCIKKPENRFKIKIDFNFTFGF